MDAARSVVAGFAAAPASFVVSTASDGFDATTDGVCATTGSQCTLRAALTEANATSTIADTITFSVNGTHEGILFQITSPVTITGNGSGQTAISSNDQGPSLTVGGGSGQVTLRDLRVVNGKAFGTGTAAGPLPPAVRGGGINFNGNQMTPPTLTLDHVVVSGNEAVAGAGGDDYALGGGIFVSFFANLVLDHSTVSNNTASGGTGQATTEGAGGGIFTVSPVTIVDSAVSDNTVLAGSVRSGGGIDGISFAGLNVVRSTVSGNSTTGGRGGGILMDSLDTTAITNSTISGNTAGAGGGGGAVLGSTSSTISASTFAGNTATGGSGADVSAILGQTTVKSSIFASSGACATSGSGGLVSAGRNLDNGSSCGWGTSNGNLQNTNPMLGSLTNNGGPTLTRALMPGSPAIDTGSAVDGVITDQRGAPNTRPQGAGCDIGAFELDNPGVDASSCLATSVPAPPAQPPTAPAAPKKCKKGQKLRKGKCVKAKRKKKK
jgi:hypothetical protein